MAELEAPMNDALDAMLQDCRSWLATIPTFGITARFQEPNQGAWLFFWKMAITEANVGVTEENYGAWLLILS